MKPDEVLKIFLKTLNPDSYANLIKKNIKETTQYFLYIILFSLLLTTIISLPFLIKFPGHFSEEINKFDRFTIKINQSMNEPIHLGNIITIDTTNKTKNITTEKILITKDYVYTKNKFCLLFDTFCFLNKNIEKKKTTEYSNIIEYNENISKTIYLLLILLSPFIFISLYLFYVIKYIILILSSSIIIFLVLFLAKRKLSIKNMKVGLKLY